MADWALAVTLCWRDGSSLLRFPGSGTSKKLAKRNAAAKMLARIHDVPVDQRNGNEAEPEDDQFSIVSPFPFPDAPFLCLNAQLSIRFIGFLGMWSFH